MLMLVLTQVFNCFGKHLICNFHDDFLLKLRTTCHYTELNSPLTGLWKVPCFCDWKKRSKVQREEKSIKETGTNILQLSLKCWQKSSKQTQVVEYPGNHPIPFMLILNYKYAFCFMHPPPCRDAKIVSMATRETGEHPPRQNNTNLCNSSKLTFVWKTHRCLF